MSWGSQRIFESIARSFPPKAHKFVIPVIGLWEIYPRGSKNSEQVYLQIQGEPKRN